jgi:hypothetical protein
MRLGWILIAAAGLGVLSGAAQNADDSGLHYSDAATKKELVAVVASQLAAFRAGDAARAYAFAARELRENLSREKFSTMIAHTYPAIAHNVRAEFGLSLDDGATALLPVDVFTADGHATSYRYFFMREEGVWRISGVVRDTAPSRTNEI